MQEKLETAKKHTILLVDDEDNVRSALRRTLRGEGYEILEASSGEQGLATLRAQPVDVVISDHAMPNMTGLEFLRVARLLRPDTLRIILTGQADLEMAVRAINEDAIYRFLLKPWDQLDLRVMLRLAIRHLDSERRNARLLELVRKQTKLLEKLERENPHLFDVERDDRGAIIVSEEELAILGDTIVT
ncbi:MAG: response regulator [Deltaproteobacteria bacterium]|nr:response regulator [Deltaproteobacteria bacterium]